MPARLQVSLRTTDLRRSVDYYRTLFDCEPSLAPDGATRFSPSDPLVDVTLVEQPYERGGAVNHWGLRTASEQDVDAARHRLLDAGVSVNVEPHTVCGYARQYKVWSSDPDGRAWEVYVVHADLAPSASRTGAACGCSTADAAWRPTPLGKAAFHFGLGVADLKASVEFYRRLLGVEPAKQFDDYAKFEIAEPSFMFSLMQHPSASGGDLREIRLLTSDEEHRQIQEGLRRLGRDVDRNRSNLEVVDPDGVVWRFVAQATRPLDDAPSRYSFAKRQAVVWTHHLSQPFPTTIPHADGQVAEIRLSGSFNAREAPLAIDRLLAEARRAIAPDGRVIVTGLVSDHPFPGEPQFPAPAAQIEHVPLQTEPARALLRAGFAAPSVEKLSPVSCLDGRGVGLLSLVLHAGLPPQ